MKENVIKVPKIIKGEIIGDNLILQEDIKLDKNIIDFIKNSFKDEDEISFKIKGNEISILDKNENVGCILQIGKRKFARVFFK